MILQLSESKFRYMLSEMVKEVLLESSHSLYHFVSLSQLLHIISKGFSLNDRETMYKPDNSKRNNFLSTSRLRNIEQGFPYMLMRGSEAGVEPGTTHNDGGVLPQNLIIRIELNRLLLQQHGRIKPFDYLYQDEEINGKQDVLNLLDDNIEDIETVNYIKHQPYAQSEDRLWSSKSTISKEDTLKLIECIDIYVDIENIDKGLYQALYKDFNKLFNIVKNIKIPIHWYNNKNHFNHQTNNCGTLEDLLQALK